MTIGKIEKRKAVIKSVKGMMALHAISTDNHRNEIHIKTILSGTSSSIKTKL
jgi:hypothetical protein